MADTELPHLPAVTTATEATELIEKGYTDMVLHPAAAVGGRQNLRFLAAFVPAARFCPSGGITAAQLTGYLATPNVGCVSADWLAPATPFGAVTGTGSVASPTSPSSSASPPSPL